MNAFSWLQVAAAVAEPLIQIVVLPLLALVGLWIQRRIRHEQTQAALLLFNEHVAATVGQLARTTVPALRASAEHGKLSESDKAGLRISVLKAVSEGLPEADLRALSKVLGPALEELIHAKVDAELRRRA